MAVFSNAVPVAQSLLRSFLFGRILEHPKQMLRIVEQNAGWSNSSLDKSSLTVFVNLYTECRAVKEAENSIGSDCIVVSGVSRTLQARIKSMRQESATMIRVKSIYITSRHVTSRQTVIRKLRRRSNHLGTGGRCRPVMSDATALVVLKQQIHCVVFPPGHPVQ